MAHIISVIQNKLCYEDEIFCRMKNLDQIQDRQKITIRKILIRFMNIANFPDCKMRSRFGYFGFQTALRPNSEMMARLNLEREIKLVARIMFK